MDEKETSEDIAVIKEIVGVFSKHGTTYFQDEAMLEKVRTALTIMAKSNQIQLLFAQL